MEIERKWLLKKIPKHFPSGHYNIEQFYLTTNPELRFRKKIDLYNNEISYKLTIKGEGTIMREENEMNITEGIYENFKKLVNKQPIVKDYYTFWLNGYKIEISQVDNDFIYAEIEFNSIEEATTFQWDENYFGYAEDVTYNPAYKMKNYWIQTRQ